MFHRAHLARPCRPQESPTITAGRRALIWSACHFVCVPAIMGVHGTTASEPWIFIQGIASRERAHMPLMARIVGSPWLPALDLDESVVAIGAPGLAGGVEIGDGGRVQARDDIGLERPEGSD